jgi:hydrogenase maturation protein HypF
MACGKRPTSRKSGPEYMQLLARKIILSGVVQGVGFRPFIYRHAQLNQLTGWVRNSSGRVEVHVQGKLRFLDEFENTLIESSPGLSQAVIESVNDTPCLETDEFQILASLADADADIHLPADLFTCDDCLQELIDRFITTGVTNQVVATDPLYRQHGSRSQCFQ